MDGSKQRPRIPASDTITYREIVELSRVIHPSIPRWPGDPPVRFQEVAHLEKDGYFLREFSMGEHSATHMNAPISFHPGGTTIDAYPTESLVVPAVVIDVRDQVESDADYALSRAKIQSWELRHDRLSQGAVVLLHTGWQDRWGDPDRYFGRDPSGGMHFPGFGEDAARFLLSQRGAAGLGIDTHGLEPGEKESFSVNKLVLEQPRLALENLTNLDRLPPTGATLVVAVLRLQGGSGSPVSVLAFVP